MIHIYDPESGFPTDVTEQSNPADRSIRNRTISRKLVAIIITTINTIEDILQGDNSVFKYFENGYRARDGLFMPVNTQVGFCISGPISVRSNCRSLSVYLSFLKSSLPIPAQPLSSNLSLSNPIPLSNLNTPLISTLVTPSKNKQIQDIEGLSKTKV